MRTSSTLFVALALGLTVGLANALPASAEPSGPTARDIPAAHKAFPLDYPVWASDYYALMDRSRGRVEAVVPEYLAGDYGVNTASNANAANCTPDAAEGGATITGAARRAWIDDHCRLVGYQARWMYPRTAAPSDTNKWDYRGQARRVFWRHSDNATCTDAPARNPETSSVGLNYGATGPAVLDFGHLTDTYVCLAQGFEVRQRDDAGITAYMRLRSPWTVYKLVGLGERAKATNISATPRDGAVRVSWRYPGSPDPTGLILRNTSFVVTAAPGGNTCSVQGRTNCIVRGLTNGTAYTFTVATNLRGYSIAAGPTAPVTPQGAAAPSPSATPTPTPTPTATQAATPSASASASASPSASSSLIIETNVNPLPPQARPASGTSLRAGQMATITSMVTGQLAAGQSVAQRTTRYCYVNAINTDCSANDVVHSWGMNLNLMKQSLPFTVPSGSAGRYLRTEQSIVISPGPGFVGSIRLSTPQFTLIAQ